jgi:hypothetical protein
MGMAIIVFFFGGYYLLREMLNPGYMRAVVENEMTGRYFHTLEENEAPFYHYMWGIYFWRFRTWFYIVPLGILLGYWSKEQRTSRFLNFAVVTTVLYLLVISMSRTKLEWYDLPVFPYLIMMVALFFHMVIRALSGEEGPLRIPWGRNLVTVSILLFFFMAPYYQVYKLNRSGEAFRQDETYRLSHYLRGLDREGSGPEVLHIVHEGKNAQQFLFYVYLLRESGSEITISTLDQVEEAKTYLVHQPVVMESLRSRYSSLQARQLEEGIFLVTL